MTDQAKKIVAQLFYDMDVNVGETYKNSIHSKEKTRNGLGFFGTTIPSLSVWTYHDRVDYRVNNEYFSIPL